MPNILVTLHERHGVWNRRRVDFLFNGVVRLVTKTQFRITNPLWRESSGDLVDSPHKGQ